MYVRQIRDAGEFVAAVQQARRPVRVSERAVAVPVREQRAVVVRPALERQYSVEMNDALQGATRLVFTEHLIERDGAFPFSTSVYKMLKDAGVTIIEVGRISHAA